MVSGCVCRRRLAASLAAGGRRSGTFFAASDMDLPLCAVYSGTRGRGPPFARMTTSLILFDLDGTLVDSAPDIARALNAAMAEIGVPPLPVPEVVGYVGDGAAKLVERALPDPPPPEAEIPGLVDAFRRHYAAHVCVDTRVYPGVAAVLRDLAAGGATMAVLTNKPGDLARALLRALAIDGMFADVIGDGDGWPRKPAPDAGRALLARHGVAPQAALVVGDGLPDVRLARAAGIPVAAVSWGYTARALLEAERPDWIVDDPAGLLPLAAALRPGR